jgi:GNAT superfamily N-acetyltransferase
VGSGCWPKCVRRGSGEAHAAAATTVSRNRRLLGWWYFLALCLANGGQSPRYGRFMTVVRQAELSSESGTVARLWLEYLSWGNSGLEARYGFRLPVEGAVEQDLATVDKFEPPGGRLLLAFEGGSAVGVACLRRIAADTAEIKRMYVEPAIRGRGIGGALLDAAHQVGT